MENTKFGRVYTERPHMNYTMHALQELKCLGFGKLIIMPDLDSLEENCFLFPQRVVDRNECIKGQILRLIIRRTF